MSDFIDMLLCLIQSEVVGALWCPYLILVGFFQRLNFFLVFVILGVESINYLERKRIR